MNNDKDLIWLNAKAVVVWSLIAPLAHCDRQYIFQELARWQDEALRGGHTSHAPDGLPKGEEIPYDFDTEH